MATEILDQSRDSSPPSNTKPGTASTAPAQVSNSEQAPQKRNNQQAQAAARRQSTRQQYSVPFITNTLTLKTHHAQHTFERGFPICAEAIFTLSVVMRVVAPEQDAVQVDAAVETQLSTVRAELTAESERLNRLAEASGVVFSGVQYSMPREFTPRITSPRATLYLSLLRQMDDIVEKMDTLWLAGVINDSVHNQGIFQWQRRILRLSGAIRTLVVRAMSAAQRKDIHNVQDPRTGTLLDTDAAPTEDVAKAPSETATVQGEVAPAQETAAEEAVAA